MSFRDPSASLYALDGSPASMDADVLVRV
jgi:hypothetical protein